MSSRIVRVIAAAALGGAAVVAAPASPASAVPMHVAIVVAGIGTACVPAGGTGLDLLNSRYTLRVGGPGPYAGFVLTIDGIGTTRPDNTHYWSYWHDTGAGWQYSSSGAGSYHPAAGTVEGWSFVNGTSSASQPPRYRYAAICGSADPHPSTSAATSRPPPRPRPTHSASTLATTLTRATAARPPRARPATSHRVTPATTSTHPARRAAHPSRTRRPPIPTPATTSGTPVTRSSTAATRSSTGAVAVPPAALPTAPAVRRSSASSLPAWGTAGALAMLGALGALAYWRTRRRVD